MLNPFTNKNQSKKKKKKMMGNIGSMFVKCIRRVTNGNLYHLFGVSDYYVTYRQRAKRVS